MKKMILVLFLSLMTMSFLAIGCGGKYSDVKEMNAEYVSQTETYVAELDKAENAQDAAAAMNRYADAMEDLMPKMRKLAEKYPELKDKANVPEDLKEGQKRAEESSKKLAGAMMKAMPYMMDPEVQQAQKRIVSAMLNK